MSRDVLEKVLYDLSTSRQNKEAFTAEADKFLGRYQLSEAEKDLVKGYEVRKLADLGVNTMLTWGFWLQSGRKNGEYMKAMQGKSTV
ncbi:hypothetical protein [Rhizobium sp. ICMP 5592]|uniref:hypothetical protein n=1 Tax=Rhizobium sp. ICMP 5592 TaxID=2292445 RepID=UPI001296EA57|nr:hypothetical protein [Rhizobium sp. ICMP 5592]MQB46111.1 hypothetical protein [Rhizobium sp. ICMP 5592]